MAFRLNIMAGLLVAALLLGGGFRRSAEGLGIEEGPEPGFRAPAISGETLAGDGMSLSDLRGKAVFINFWASWCGPCLLEMPEIQRLYEHLPPQTAILTVNMTDTEASPGHVAAFMEQRGWTFPVVLDPGSRAALAYRAVALPTSVFVGADGLVRSRHVGPLTEGAMRSRLQAALQAPVVGGRQVGPSVLPDVVLIGQWPLNTSILALLAGLLTAYFWGAARLGTQGGQSHLAGDVVSGLALGGFIGAKLVAVAAAPGAYLARPLLLLAQEWTPASMAGAAVGALGWAAWELRRAGNPVRVLDLLAAPLLLGGAFVLAPAGVAHALLLALAAAAVVAVPQPPGQGVLTGILGAALALVVAEFTRPVATVAAGLSAAQMGLGAVGLAAYFGARWLGQHPPAAPDPVHPTDAGNIGSMNDPHAEN